MFWTDLGIIGGKQGYNKEPRPYGWLVNEVRAERAAMYRD
jgi:hypothetical protein